MTPVAVLAAIGLDAVDFALWGGDAIGTYGAEHVASARYPTFSDALLRYADRHQVNLYGTQLCVAIAGTVEGDAIRVTNGRWYVSRSGLSAVTGRPAHFLNDVSAIGHAILAGHSTRPIGIGSLGVDVQRGCSIVVFADRGLGAAVIHRNGADSIGDSEAGHAEFTPRTDAENDIARAIRSDGRVTYEQMLIALTRNGYLLRPVTSLQMDRVMLATILGRYCNMLALSVAAWNGIYLCGGALDGIDRPDLHDAFYDGFLGQGGMRNRLCRIPMMAVDQRGAIIRGLAAFSAR